MRSMTGLARRGLLIVGGAAMLLPMLGRADDGEDPDPRRLELGARAVGGRTRYSSCGTTYEVAHAGGSLFVESGGPGQATYRAEAGGAVVREREVDNDDGDPVDPTLEWSGSLSVLGMIGEDWKYFGFLIGGGVVILGDGWAPVPALSLRFGPRKVHFDLHLLDFVPLYEGLAGLELAFVPLEDIEMGVGVRAHLQAEAPMATFRMDFPIGNEMRMGILMGVSEMAGDLVGQAELSLRIPL